MTRGSPADRTEPRRVGIVDGDPARCLGQSVSLGDGDPQSVEEFQGGDVDRPAATGEDARTATETLPDPGDNQSPPQATTQPEYQ